ncbi:hypothetical protein ACP4OV_018183 [Aristida adscensionis]
MALLHEAAHAQGEPPPVVYRAAGLAASQVVVTSPPASAPVANRAPPRPPSPWRVLAPAPGQTTASSMAASDSALAREVEKKPLVSDAALTPPPPATARAAVVATPVGAAAVEDASVSKKGLGHPARPGAVGKKVMIRANHFLVNVAGNNLFHDHHDVYINPKLKSRGTTRIILNGFIKLHGKTSLGGKLLAYTGRTSFYTAGLLPFGSEELVITLFDPKKKDKERAEREYNIKIQIAGRTKLYHLQQFLHGILSNMPQETVQVLDIVYRVSPSWKHVTVSRSISTSLGLSLNIEISATSFFKRVTVIKSVEIILSVDSDNVKMNKALLGFRCRTSHKQDETRNKIAEITPMPMSQLIFRVNEDGMGKTIVVYIWDKCYGFKYAWPYLQAGSGSRPVYLPVKVCTIGQRYHMKLSDKEVISIHRAIWKHPQEQDQNTPDVAGCDTVPERALAPSSIPSVLEAPAVILGAHVASIPQGDDSVSYTAAAEGSNEVVGQTADVEHSSPRSAPPSLATVFICVCGHEIPVTTNLNKSTVGGIVKTALNKKRMKIRDAFLKFNGRALNPNKILSSLPNIKGSHIHVIPRIRGGVPLPWFTISKLFEPLPNLMQRTRRFHDLTVPADLMIIGVVHPHKPLLILSNLAKYIIHQMLVCVCRLGHQRGLCWNGGFQLDSFSMSIDGNMILNAPVFHYTPDGAYLDYVQLHQIFSTWLHDPRSDPGYRLHVTPFLDMLLNHDPIFRRNENFITYLINHPCLLSYADRHKLYLVIDSMLRKLTEDEVKNLRATLRRHDLGSWQTYVTNVPGYLNTFMYNAKFDAESNAHVTIYTENIDQGFHFCRNFLSHPPDEVTLEVAEASLSLVLDFLLNYVFLTMVLYCHNVTSFDIVGLISNTNADGSIVSQIQNP